MKMLKRSLAWMLALIMMISAVPFTAFASESTDVPSEATEAVVDAPAGETTPSEGAEEETVPETTVAETTVPETTVAEETVPETTVAEETVPETTVAEETVPETTVAEETVPETTVAEETVPEETVADEPVEEVPAVMSLPRTTSSAVEYQYNVVHLDAGRKYFSVDSIKAIIDNIEAAGFNQLQLYLSDNQGFRFALDDMTLTTTYGTYDLTPALGDGYSSSDNKAPDGTGKYLTQSEMDTIITYAHSKGIDIVPAINVPGHMGAILEEFTSFRYTKNGSTSKSSISLDNEEAVAFALALTEKYAAYFASKGCKYYCVGADEYANDLSSMGFEGMGSTLYTKFVEFLNDAADIVIAKGMTPRAFNDGFYYKDYSISVTPNTAYQVYYWSAGWNGYEVAAASTISANGHEMINTNGDYYWILGGTQCTAATAANFSTTAFQGSTVSDPAGSMFCIWSDVGNALTEAQVITNSAPVIAAFGGALPEVEDLVSGIVTPDPEPEVPETVTKTDEETKVAVTAPGLTELTVTTVEEAELPVVETAVAGKVVAWEMAPATEAGTYVGEATVSVPVPADWTNVRGGVLASDNGKEVMGIKGTLENGVFTFTVPHFSTVVTYASDYDTLVKLTIGETYDVVIEGKDLSNTTYTPNPAGVANVTVSYKKVDGETVVTLGDQITPTNSSGWSDTGVIKSGDYYLVMDSTGALSATTDVSQATVFTVKRSDNNSRWTIQSGSHYLCYNNSSLSGSTSNYSWRYNDGFYLSSSNNSYYLTYSNGDWTTARYNPTESYLYDVSSSTTDPVDESTVTFTGVAEGETYVTVEGEVYKIVVSKAAVTDTVTVNASKTYEDTSTNVTVADPSIATATLNNGTLTITGVKVGSTTVTTDNAVYTITVTEIDLSTVTPLAIEHWITNRPVNPDVENYNTSNIDHEGDTQANAQRVWINVSAADAYSGDGVALTALVAPTGKDAHITSNIVVFWKGVALDTSTNQQTTLANDNESSNGTVFTKVRYWTEGWQVFDGTNWVDVTEDTQLVAYYLQKTVVTNLDVVQTEVVDWGEVYGNTTFGDADFVALDFAIQYEDGTRNPDAFAVEDKTLLFHCADSALNTTVFRDSNGNKYRRIGTIRATETSNYEVYMITITPNSDTVSDEVASRASSVDTIDYEGTEKVVWVDDVKNLGEFADTSLQHADFTVGGEPTIQKVDIYNQQAVLITYYVKAKVTADSLTVHYMDRSAGDIQFYSYNIAVAEGTYFDKDIALADPWKGDLVNGTVQTIDPDVTQTVSSDLSTLPAVAAQYLYSEYECVELKPVYTTLEDGTQVLKDVYLYYTFNPTVTFVVDFGLPIEITATDLNSRLEGIVSDMSVPGGSYTTYGQITDNDTSLTYTPTEVMQDGDFFTVLVTTTAASGILDETANQVAFRVYVVPATTVYYEESFMTYTGTWSSSAKPTTTQDTESFNEYTKNDDGSITITTENKKNPYGYDPAYASDAAASNNTMVSTSTNGDSASFTFTGTGFELYANCNAGTGYVTVTSEGETKKMYMVDTGLNYEKLKVEMPGANTNPTGTFYNIPIISEKNLAHGTYTVNIRKTNRDGQAFVVDGFRVINTIEDSTIYAGDLEDEPDFYQLRDTVLHAIGTNSTAVEDSSVDYPTMYEQVYNAVAGESALITAEDVDYDDSVSLQELLDNGPKNEIYLFKGQTLTFNVQTSRAMQIGLKAPNGVTTYTMKLNDTVVGSENAGMNTSVDMFYELSNTTGTTQTFTVSVTNTGDKILAVTDLKICDDPNASFVPLTVDDIAMIMGADADDEVVEPETTEPETTVPETTKPAAKPTKPSKPQETTKPQTPTKPETPNAPQTPSVPQTPSKPQTPSVPEADKKADAVLTVALVDYAGRKLGSAVLSANGAEGAAKVFTAAEILATAKAMLPQQYAFVDEAKIADTAVAYGEEHTVSIQVGKVATLKINYISLFGRKLGSATITKVQTAGGRCLISASEIRAQAPNGRFALWLLPVSVNYGATASVAAVLF